MFVCLDLHPVWVLVKFLSEVISPTQTLKARLNEKILGKV